jgi:HK97 family phage major capsid protein
MSHFTTLRDKLEKHVAAAQVISRKAEDANRDFTPAETVIAQQHLDAIRELGPQVKAAHADEKMTAKLRGLGPDAPGGSISAGGSGSGGFAPSTGFRATGSNWSRSVAGQITRKSGAAGTKDISTGNLAVANVIETAVEIPARPLRLLDLIPTKSLPGPSFSYIKQTLRQSNAAPVADHAEKPVSQYQVEQVEGKAVVFAHISDPVAARFFDDFEELMSLIDVEMYQDLRRAIEDNIATGDGTGENFTGLLETSGTYAQPYAVSLPATLRAARVTLEVANETPTSWLMNPADIAKIDLLTDSEGRYFTGEVDALMGGLPKVPSAAIPAGQAILGDWSLTRLYVREEANLAIDGGGELFKRNELVMRYEGRYGWAVLRPSAFNIVDLTA